jgi:hypothetical protein
MIEKKGKTLTLCSNLEVAEGFNVRGDEVGDESNHRSRKARVK